MTFSLGGLWNAACGACGSVCGLAGLLVLGLVLAWRRRKAGGAA